MKMTEDRVILLSIWFSIASYVILEKTFIKRWTIPLSNARQYLYQTLTILLPNVRQYFYQTLDNTFAKRWAIPLPNVGQYPCQTFGTAWQNVIKRISIYFISERHSNRYEHRRYAFAIWWSMGGRYKQFRPPPKILNDNVMHTSVVEWSKFSEK